MEVVTDLSKLNEIFQGIILSGVIKPSEIMDCAGKGIKELVENRNIFIHNKEVFIAVRRLKKGKGVLLACLIHNFCREYKNYKGHPNMGGAAPPEKKDIEDKEFLEFVRQGGNFFDE